ncbi:DHHW family protein [Moraxella marmotae]|uniref:DHHW family protein n=1 Tax=Moraxella marmotae TaxID=3344520 RepID=UPI0035F23943
MILNSVLFIIAMIVGGVAFWLLPEQKISADENRELMKQPEATQESVLSGKYSKLFEEYYNDHFPLRDRWIAFANEIKLLKGKQNDEFRVITTSSDTSETDDESADQPANNPQAADSDLPKDPLASLAADDEINQAEFSKVKGTVVVKGRVVQNFGGSKATVSPFADMLNEYRQKLDPSVNLYTMIIPSGSDFYLPKQVSKGVLKEKQNIEEFNTLLAAGVVSVPAYEEMWPHKGEYIMYRTDHHWTGLGAYYAYRAFAKTVGFVPVELEQMQFVKSEQTFMGSLYKYTRDEALKKNPDTMEYYQIPNLQNIQAFVNTSKTNINDATSPWVLYYEKTNNYGLFLGGDYPLVKIVAPNHSGRKILLIKDSFGNALAPYLANHFDEVFVIDYRHFKGGILTLIKTHGITDVLYAHNSFAANSHAVVKLGKSMMK